MGVSNRLGRRMEGGWLDSHGDADCHSSLLSEGHQHYMGTSGLVMTFDV